MILATSPQLSLSAIRAGWAALFLASLAACEPTIDQRMTVARQHIASGAYSASIIELKNVLRAAPRNAQARALIAQSFYQLADFPSAITEYERALEYGGSSTELWIGLGESLMRAGRAADALERVAPNLDRHSTDDRETALYANILLALGNKEEAATIFDAMLEIDEESQAALIGLATIASASGLHDQFYEYMERATESAAVDPRAHLLLGYYHRSRQDLGSAIDAFRLAIEGETAFTNNADRFEARAAMTTSLIDAGDFASAKDLAGRLAGAFPGHPIHNYLSGRIAFGEGRLDDASRALQRYMRSAPDDLRANVVIGAVSFYQNYYSQAEMYLRQAVRRNVGGETAIRLLAEARLRLNKPRLALDALQNANFRKADALSLDVLGRAEFRAGNREVGLRYLAEGVQTDPDNPEIYLTYAMALVAEGELDEAIDVLGSIPAHLDTGHRGEILKMVVFEKSGQLDRANLVADRFLSANPDDAIAHALVGSFMQAIDLNDQAARYFDDALAIDSGNHLALLGVARIEMDRGEDAAAETLLAQLLDRNPTNLPALHLLSDLLISEGQFGKLLSRIDTAVTAAPMIAELRVMHARTLFLSGNPTSALKVLRAAREEFAGDAMFLHLEGRLLAAIGQTESALVVMGRAAALEPENAAIQFDLASARLDVRDYFGASDAIGKYRSQYPDEAAGLSIHVGALIGLGEYEKARIEIEKAALADENRAVRYILDGDIELAEGNADTAVALYERAAEIAWDRGLAVRLSTAYLATGSDKAPQPLARWLSKNPDDGIIRRRYGELLQFMGANENAVEQYEAVVAERPDDVVALNNLAWEYSLAGRPEAVDIARRAYELSPEQPSIIDTYAWILFLNGEPDRAIVLLREAATLAPANGNINYHLAKVLAESGERGEAQQMIEKLLSSGTRFSSRPDAEILAESLQ